jgi:acetylornithine/succinyldiaminopimelate/putrescine aminotransferase
MLGHSTHMLQSRSLPAAPVELEAVRGEGAFVIDAAGRRYLDAACGSGSLIFGHGDASHLNVAAGQMAQLTVHASRAFRIEANERYAEALCRRSHWHDPRHDDEQRIGRS